MSAKPVPAEPIWYRIFFQQPRGTNAWKEQRRPVVVAGEVERDRILARKRPKAVLCEVARIYECDQCHRRGPWTDDWRWFGSWADLDDGKPVLKFCSRACGDAYAPEGKPGGTYEPARRGENRERYRVLQKAREAPTAHRKVPMPDWPGPGSCRWCLKPTVWEMGKKKGRLAPKRNWHNACYYQYRLHTEIAAQFDFLFDRDGPRCRACGAGGYAELRSTSCAGGEITWTILKPSIVLEVDHIFPLWRFSEIRVDDRRRLYGPENLWLLCLPCHKKKTRLEAAERATRRRLSEAEGPPPAVPLLILQAGQEDEDDRSP